MGYAIDDIINAHKYCSNNMVDLKQKQKCGCFYCLEIFQSDEIEEHIDDIPHGTAVCPYCFIDAVIGETSGYPIQIDFLESMKEYWF